MTSEAISETTRDRTIDLIQRAYSDARIDEPELEHRLNLALRANTHAELRLAIDGLPLPASSRSEVQPRTPTPSRFTNPDTDKLAPIAHASALVLGPLGPGLGWLMSRGQGRTHHEITKALNFQILAMMIYPVAILLTFMGIRPLLGLWVLTWAALTVLGAVKANRGEDWENPLTQLTGFRPVAEDHGWRQC